MPETASEPVQPPDAKQEVALVADQVNSAVAPYAIEVELAVNVSTGGGGGAAVIMTELEVDPP